ncbi:hypothetical protein AMJ82_10155 [candidate division TA06 bacterium SM23_40]|uniref:Cytochrome c7-like domain-containing protein n=1 Tax=candidate division TA06 bacterium SM23_40 TaxID=1703774 RepID=A0A0S8G4D0_UNCT6|nr:MAG: hypothetical protein AMJ82_10155 [candidate division TA06 bacterium SM23_40]
MPLTPQEKTIVERRRVLWIWGVIILVGALAALVVVLVGVIAVGGVGLAGYAGMHMLEQPITCTICHNMRPAVELWKASTHAGIICAECHSEPGPRGRFKGTVLAPIRETFLYVTGNYGKKPMIADIRDESCMRTHCHKSRLLHGEVSFKGVVFDHSRHFESLLGVKRLQCASCHSDTVAETHMATTGQTCFICHLRENAIADVPSGCPSCHRAPPEPIEFQGTVFDHQHPIVRDDPCESCHDNISRGGGSVNSDLCVECHGEAHVVERISNSGYIHQLHVVDHTVNCLYCHEAVTHAIEKEW